MGQFEPLPYLAILSQSRVGEIGRACYKAPRHYDLHELHLETQFPFHAGARLRESYAYAFRSLLLRFDES